MYRSRYKSAILLEGFGIGPIMSVNYEMTPIRNQKSYFAGRIGLGYLPANFGNGAGYSIPAGATYNVLLNNLKKGIYKRVMNKCKTKPPKFDLEYFAEMGGGHSWVIYPTSTNRHYFNAYGALKVHMLFDIPPKTKVISLKVSINPRINRSGITFYESSPLGGENFFGGFALGFSL